MKNKPEISRMTELRSNCVVQIFGEGFEDDSQISIWYPEHVIEEGGNAVKPDLPEVPPEGAMTVSAGKNYGQVIYLYPSKNIRDGAAVVWVRNSSGLSKPFLANVPRIFNVSHKKIVKGSMLSVYGTSFGLEKNKVLLLLNKHTGKTYYIDNLINLNYTYNREKYVADFLIPSTIESGEYLFAINGGSGGNYGWSDMSELQICDSAENIVMYYREQWNSLANVSWKMPKAKLVLVDAPKEGAYVDSTASIQEAIDSLKDGGIVMLSAGVYGIRRTLRMRNGVVLKGAGSDNTIIRPVEGVRICQDWSDIVPAQKKNGASGWANDWVVHYKKYNPAALICVEAECGIDSIRFELGSGANIGILIASKDVSPVCGAFINKVSVDACYLSVYKDERGYGAVCCALLAVAKTEELTVCNSVFKALSPINLLPSSHVRAKLVNNVFECLPKQEDLSYIATSYHGVFIGNQFVGGRRNFMTQGGFSNNFVYQNTTSGGTHSVNALECYMSEYGDAMWNGKCSACTPNSICIADNLDIACEPLSFSDEMENSVLLLFVLDGKGFGQYRRITDYQDGVVYLDKSWDVLPDETTYFTIVTTTLNNIWLNNDSKCSNGASQFFYGGGIDNVIAGHETYMAAGIRLMAYGARYSKTEICAYDIVPAAFNVIEGCQIRNSGQGVFFDSPYLRDAQYIEKETSELPEALEHFRKTSAMFGNTIHNNVFEGSESSCYEKNQTAWRTDWHEAGIALGGAYNLVTKNRLIGYKNGIKLINNCEGNYIGGNVFSENQTRVIGYHNAIGPDTTEKGV